MDGQRWEKDPRFQVSKVEETLSLLMNWEPKKEVSLFKNETGLERESFDLQGSRGNRSLWRSGPVRGGREVMGSWPGE